MTVPLRTLAVHALGLALANADAGVHETGDNAGDAIEYWQKLGGGEIHQSWCCYFVLAMFVKAWCQSKGLLTGKDAHENRAIMLAHVDEFSRETHIPRTGSCQAMADAAKKQGRFHNRAFTPSPGDMVFFQFHGADTHHIGLVVSGTDTMVSTVEGNTSASGGGSQANGDGVFRKQRGRSVVYGFCHLA